ncbi:ras-related protein Rab-32 [Nannospalax galili]|uniref:Ras-related protein Rab n=1 Tax=Nannospalax galili TaxID=1026970 RepID=A0A8C6WAQ8_NANGA|nr:ras-related protein Rab-32 [Nannospalax galili]
MAGEGPGVPGATATAAPETREHLFKVLVIGELGVGKTSIIKRYVHQLFSQHYRATIGVDFALKVLSWDHRTLVRLQLWDIAGQERFGNMTRVYYKEAVGAFVVFDLSRSSTFEAVLKWKSDLDSKVHLPNGNPIPAVLLANKCDQKRDSSQSPSQLDQFCKDHGFTGWFETSAKDNINIDEATRFLVENILANDQNFPREENDMDKIKLGEEPFTTKPRSQCC